jgi:ectoine hydroxylase-related dioxygenase (phytanoyl-CoA dioxygenase family)
VSIVSTAAQALVDEGIREVTDEEGEFFREHGWVRLDGLLSADLAAEILSRTKARMGENVDADMHDNREAIMTPQLRALWKDWQNPAEEDDFFRALSQSAAMGRMGRQLLRGRDARWWSDSILCKLPSEQGGARTPWHQDFPYLSMDRIGMLNLWTALVEMPPEMGTMRFLDRSHRLGPMGRIITRGEDLLELYPWIADEYEVTAPLALKPGDATVHDWMLVHAAPPNETEQPRWAYINSMFPADALFTGAQQRRTDGLGLEVNQPFDHPRFPLLDA